MSVVDGGVGDRHPQLDGAHNRVGNNRAWASSSLGQQVPSVVWRASVGTRIVTRRGPTSAHRHGTRTRIPAPIDALSFTKSRQSPPPQRLAPIGLKDRPQPRASSETERAAILAELHSERFVDTSATEVWATLLDEGRYLGSISAFYRLLRQAGESQQRRR
ncbi:hypothetical protein A9W98_12065 [Mycobacterium gordonae]|uniref:Uncharacterized protein n=1 Tax=Mycobacterium gordonae TaxID=1778 RepID=A0A1A6BKY2_MYCGO|nr:hypothetical protein A9W98_12065 [Mycobacterium gordonae]